MKPPAASASELAAALRSARRARRLSIAALATEAGVSPRLISEFEQGKRPNVSLETVLRLLQLVRVRLVVAGATEPVDVERARAERAARRRQSWSGLKTTLDAQDAPVPPNDAAARLAAVANSSRLAVSLQRAAARRRS